MQKQKLIINADDFGETFEKNRAITWCMLKGLITNCTIIANTDSFVYACEIYEKELIMKNRVGIHLNIALGAPLTDAIKKHRSFCDRNGEFYFNRYRNIYLDKEGLQALYFEFQAQIKRVKSFGIDISHIDTHHHTHWHYHIYSVIKELAKEFDINKIRLARNLCTSENIFKKCIRPI